MVEQQQNFIDVSTTSLLKKARQIFVAYSYRHYDKRDFRAPFLAVGKAFGVDFVFADEKITSLHILQKIANYIRESQFGIYDITAWNPNVTLELGLALGMGERVFIGMNPTETDLTDVPSDLKGVDRLQYTSFATLEDELGRLISQVLPPPRNEDAENFLVDLRQKVAQLVKGTPGIGVSTIASALGVSIELAKVVVRGEVGNTLMASGVKKGTKYYPIDFI